MSVATSGGLSDAAFTAQIQDTTVQVLIAQNTLAGAAVEADRVDEVTTADMPRMIVYAGEEAEAFSDAGGPPSFTVRCTLVVQCLVAKASKDAARAAVNTMLSQVQLALLEDPVWNRMASLIESMRVTRTYKPDSATVEADGRIEFIMRWRHDYLTREPGPLTGANVRGDLSRPFDPAGDYPPTFYPVARPPRTSGPDGRVEIGADIDLPVAE